MVEQAYESDDGGKLWRHTMIDDMETGGVLVSAYQDERGQFLGIPGCSRVIPVAEARRIYAALPRVLEILDGWAGEEAGS